ncbi:hypothetical protein P691DRAFT_757612 [Macrolepiota fuliginosa MF-IS2]|uniref:Uncharacterized protein n=1 Tax=Macrolepiota fuliginosa MF-IS2 TaxID=1400762 RepID=A0A9P5XIT9_9AGAR|nr:hypothetical protein P691DRAFT_757612 [Macrolepiota fuliginosa MF-IS2]
MLNLPSSYNKQQHGDLNLSAASEVEKKLRRACAYDALWEVRNAIHRDNFIQSQKRGRPGGTKETTQSRQESTQGDWEMNAHRSYKSWFRVTYGELWFWWIGKPDGISEKNWGTEWDCVHWFREQAGIERLTEEVELLEEEFRRTIKSFTIMAGVWDELASRNFEKTGFSGYALRTAALYRSLAQDCEGKWKLALGVSLGRRLQSLLVDQISSGDDPLTQLQGVLAIAERAKDEDFQARAYYAYIKATCFTSVDEPEPVQSNKGQDFGCPFPHLKSSQLTEMQCLRLRYGYQSLRNIRNQLDGFSDLLVEDCDYNCNIRWHQWWQKTWRYFAGLAERRHGDPGEVMAWILKEVESGSGHPACSRSLDGVPCKEQKQRRVREVKSQFDKGIRRQFGLLWEGVTQ